LFQRRLLVDVDNLRRKIQEKLDLSASQLLARATAALAREVNSMEPAEWAERVAGKGADQVRGGRECWKQKGRLCHHDPR
jgi:hypothetical protein